MARNEIRIGTRTFRLPAQRRWRIALGIALIVGGILGFLPILGFWMVPLGFMIISYDIAMARRARRKTVVWWKRRNGGARNGALDAGDPPGERAVEVTSAEPEK